MRARSPPLGHRRAPSGRSPGGPGWSLRGSLPPGRAALHRVALRWGQGFHQAPVATSRFPPFCRSPDLRDKPFTDRAARLALGGKVPPSDLPLPHTGSWFRLVPGDPASTERAVMRGWGPGPQGSEGPLACRRQDPCLLRCLLARPPAFLCLSFSPHEGRLPLRSVSAWVPQGPHPLLKPVVGFSCKGGNLSRITTVQ